MEVIPAAVIAFDRNGVLTMSEGAGLAMVGTTPGRDVGESMFEQHADRPEVLASVRRTLAGEAHTGDIVIGNRTLSVGWHPLIEDGEVVGGFGFSLDVTTERAALARVEQQARRTQALADLSQRVAEAASDLGTVLAAVAETAVDTLAPAAVLFFHHAELEWVETAAHHHRDPEMRDLQERILKGLRRPVTEPVHQMLRTAAPIVVRDVPTNAFASVTPEELREKVGREAPRTYLLVPLRTRGGIIGHLALGGEDPDWPPDVQTFAVELADRAALFIDNARMLAAVREELAERTRVEHQLRRRAEREAAATALGNRALSGAGLLAVAAEGAAMVVSSLEVAACEVVERLPSGDLIVLSAVGLGLPPLSRVGEDSLAAATVREAKPVIMVDLTDQERTSSVLREQGIRSGASVPLRLGQEPLGCLAALAIEPREFDTDDVVFLETVGNIISGAIQHERMKQAEQRAAQAERLAAVGQVAAGMAHDFNNIMLAVRLYSELVADQTGLDEAGREHLRAVSTHVEHASHIVADVLNFARDLDLGLQDLDVAVVVGETLRDIAATLPATVRVVEQAAGPAVAPVDETRLRQILTNLVNNAVDAMPEGGELRVRTAFSALGPGRTSRHGGAPGRWVIIEVEDTGTGMAAETCARARDPFFTTKPPGSGTGLGLAQVERLAAEHGGALDIISAPGAGTTVTVWLPAASATSGVRRDTPARHQ